VQEELWPLQALQEGQMQVEASGNRLSRRHLSGRSLCSRGGLGAITTATATDLPERDLRPRRPVRAKLR